MQQLKENILQEILNISTTEIDLNLYASYNNVEKIIEKYFEGFTKIIIEKNLQQDFIEGLENLLNRELTSEEIEELEASDFIDNVCLNDMFQAKSDSISSYYQQYFVHKTNE